MLSLLMTTEYAPAEDRHELQQLLLHIAGGDRDALAALYQRTRTAVYGLALSYLADEERRIVLLHAVTGMKHREIAALLELPLPTVLSKYHRALKKMRIFLEGDDAR